MGPLSETGGSHYSQIPGNATDVREESKDVWLCFKNQEEEEEQIEPELKKMKEEERQEVPLREKLQNIEIIQEQKDISITNFSSFGKNTDLTLGSNEVETQLLKKELENLGKAEKINLNTNVSSGKSERNQNINLVDSRNITNIKNPNPPKNVNNLYSNNDRLDSKKEKGLPTFNSGDNENQIKLSHTEAQTTESKQQTILYLKKTSIHPQRSLRKDSINKPISSEEIKQAKGSQDMVSKRPTKQSQSWRVERRVLEIIRLLFYLCGDPRQMSPDLWDTKI